MRSLLLAAFLGFPVSLLAQPVSHADLSVAAQAQEERLTVGEQLVFGHIRNFGPDNARNVVITTSHGTFWTNHTECVATGNRCTAAQVVAGDQLSFILRLEEHQPGIETIEVTVTSTDPDPNPVNNRARTTIELVRAPHLRWWLSGNTADPGETVEYTANIHNQSAVAATKVTFTLPLREGWTFERSLSEELQCTPGERSVTCTIARIEPRSSIHPRFLLRIANDLNGEPYLSVPVSLTTEHGVIGENYEITAYFGTSVSRIIAVTNTNDSGEGSLRAAIERVNKDCVIGNANLPPCKVVFNIAGSGTHQTIRPATPLPVISGSATFDGSTQTKRHGDTNPEGPEIEINGSLLGDGHGLELTGSITVLRDLVINGFSGNGIVISASAYRRTIDGCYIGTDVTGRHAVPNRGRGISIDVPGNYSHANVFITDSVISGNGRSGVFAMNGYTVSVSGSRIGASAGERPTPLGNGASGIYFGAGVSAVSVVKNLIAYNAEAGVAIAYAQGFFAIRANSITSNGTLGIDYGLDLVTPNPAPGKFNSFPRFPVLESATYDAAANVTRIVGRIEYDWVPSSAEVELFANTTPGTAGHGEGELFLGRISLQERTFTFDYRGDLRGRFISATFTVPNSYYPELTYLLTSEFSASLKVDGEAPGPIDPALSVPRGADLGLRLPRFGRFLAGVPTRVSASVVNFGPETAKDIVVELTVDAGRLTPADSRCSVTSEGLRCVLPDPNWISFNYEAPVDRETITFRGRIVSAHGFDPDPMNNEAVSPAEVTTKPHLDLKVLSPGLVEPGATADYTIEIDHRSVVDARDVEVRVPLPNGWTLESGPRRGWDCSVEGTDIVCRTSRIKGGTEESVTYTLRGPLGDGGSRHATVFVRTSVAGGLLFEPWAPVTYGTFRMVRVTNTADHGNGSLRDAVTRANFECGYNSFQCKVVFDIPASEAMNGVFSIRPAQPLPAIDASDYVFIDARREDGLKVELNGSQTATGNGLELRGQGYTAVRGLVINGFPENGIYVLATGMWDYRGKRIIADNFIGTDATGRVAVPNGGRGLVVETEKDRQTQLDVIANVISGNARAGIFIATGATIRMFGNRIGVAAGDDAAPLPNGATGIYIDKAQSVWVESNVVAHNAHAGVATSAEASWICLRGNATHDNGSLGVDHGLDSVTFNDDMARRPDLPRFPVITSAVWDSAAKVTRIQGRAIGFEDGAAVELFANAGPDASGYGEAQRLVGTVLLQRTSAEQTFTLEVAEDLRGQFVTATLTRLSLGSFIRNWTSEISQAVPVP